MTTLAVVAGAVNAQMTLRVNVPQYYMPLLEDVYVAGTFNGWATSDPTYRLTSQADGSWTVQIDQLTNGTPLEFKFNRGDWERVEGTSTGGFVPNRQATFLNNTEQTFVIEGWEDFPGTSTASGDMNVLGTRIEIPQLDRTRRVWVYLPPGYHSSSAYYPVVYMLDGQNLFDAATSFVGEWGVDEAMEALPTGSLQAIVVGIDNGGDQRINEYSAWVNPQYGGGQGEAFATFITETLKPLIDQQFRTLTSRNYTAIMGSSLGGLMSMYMVMAFNDTFGRAGVMSPSFWFTSGIYDLAQSHTFNPNTRIFMLGGTGESATMVSNMQQMRSDLLDRGYDEDRVRLEAHEYGQHNEAYWGGEYTEVFTWLFADFDASVVEPNRPQALSLVPNPARHAVTIDSNIDQWCELMVFGLTGRMVINTRIIPSLRQAVDVSHLAPGTYRVVLRNETQTWQAGLLITH